MITKNGSGKVEEYQGKPVTPPVGYTFDYSVYENLNEAKQSQDWPSEAQILKIVNQSAERSAKAAAYQTATKALKEAYEASPEFRKAQFVKAATAGGATQAQAEGMWASLPNVG